MADEEKGKAPKGGKAAGAEKPAAGQGRRRAPEKGAKPGGGKGAAPAGKGARGKDDRRAAKGEKPAAPARRARPTIARA